MSPAGHRSVVYDSGALIAIDRGCKLIPFTAADHVPVGRLLAAAGTSDVVGAFVALLAAKEQAAVISADPSDIERLLGCLEVRMPVIPV